MQPIKDENNLAELEKLIQTIETVMMGLDAHLNDVTTLGAIKTLILDRLPPVIYNTVELTKYAPRKDIEETIKRIRQQIYLNERLYLENTSTLKAAKDSTKKTEEKKDKNNKKTQRNKNTKKCDFCEGNHYNLKCDANKTLAQKEEIVKKKGLCNLCSLGTVRES